MRDKVYVIINGKANVAFIPFRQGRQIDPATWHVYALARTERSVVFDRTIEFSVFPIIDRQSQITIIDQDMRPDRHVFDKVRIRYGNTFARRLQCRIAYDTDFIAFRKRNGRLASGSSHLRSFRVDQNSNMTRYLAHIINHARHTFRPLVRRIEPHDVHALIIQLLNHPDVAARIGNRRNDLCLFIHNYCFNYSE